MAKKKNTTNQAPKATRGDMKSQLAAIANDMAAKDPSYRQEKKRQEQQLNRNWSKLMGIIQAIYDFLRGYKFDSGIFINNFFRKRSFKEYVEDIWDEFTFNVFAKGDPFSFGNDLYSQERGRTIRSYLHALKEKGIAYHPINTTIIYLLETMADAFDFHPPVEKPDQVLYRGCTNMERNGLNGIVSTSADMKIALQFSRGTLIIIEVPEGTKWIDVAKIRARKKNPPKDFENEFLLPPCDYEIVWEKEIDKGSWGDEPNNHTLKTKVIKVRLKGTYDLLEEFMKVMENPPEEFMEIVYPYTRSDFEEAKMLLKDIIAKRKNRKNRK